MQDLPFELLFILFLGAMMIYRFATQRAAVLRPPEQVPDESDADDIPESVWNPDSLEPSRPRSELAAAPPRRASVSTSAPAAPAAPGDRVRRFDRKALLGTRRRVQDAFVVATILGRCRADEPHETP